MVYPLLKNKVVETQGLIAIMAQWNIEAENLLPIVDKINKTADDYAVSSQDLVDGLNRVGAAAKNAGLTIEETIGAITVLREASGRSGKEVGVALNTIFSYMTRNKTINLMETLGIRVFEDEAKTTFRSIIVLMEELASHWQGVNASSPLMADLETELLESFNDEMATAVGLQEEWNDVQQRDISQAAAGVRRKNFFISLMSRFSEIQGVINGQLDAEGYSMRENERTMATLEKQIESLKATAEQLAVALGDAGLLNELTGLVEGTTDAVQWFNNLDDSTQMALLTLLEVTIAVKLLSVALKGLGISGAMAGAGGLMAGWAVPIGATTAATRSLMSTLTGVSALLANVGKGAIAAFGGPVVAGIIAVSTAAIAVARSVASANDELIAHGAMAENLVGEYDKLTGKLEGLTKGTDEYNKVAEELSGLKANIAESLPELIDGWDKETDSVKINRAEMEKLIVASKDLKKSQEELTGSMEDSLKIMQAETAEHNKKAQEWESEENVLRDLAERRDKLTESLSRQKEGSEEARKTEEVLGETERLIADIAQEAGLKRNATVDEIMAKLNELKIAENQGAINTQQTELKKVDAVKEGSLARLAIIQQEMAAYSDPMSWGFMEASGKFLKQINPLNFLNKDPRHLNLDNLKKERAESVKAAQEAKAQIETIEKNIKESQRTIAGINADIATGTPDGPGAPDGSAGGGGSNSKEIDTIAEALKRLAESSKMFELVNMEVESAMAAVARKLNAANAEYDYLNGKVDAGTASSEDFARMQELLARKTALLNNEQVQLTLANNQYQQQVNALTPVLAQATAEYERFKAAGDEEHTKDAASAVSALRNEIDSLSGAIAGNTQKIWENKGAMEQLATSAYTSYYQQTMAWMQHMESIGQMSTELQAQLLSGFEEQQMTQRNWWEVEERQFQNRLTRLKEEKDKIKDAYDARMRMYENEIEANEKLIESKEKQADAAVNAIDEQIKAIQRLMDLLDDDAESEDREEAERQHNKKLAELTEERIYHEHRTGLDHQQRIKEIDDETAEEKRSWQLQQNDWARKDQKDAYQDQIDSLKEKQKAIEKSAREEINQLKTQNNRKKQEMQRFYNDLERILNDNNLRMMAASQEKGEEFIRRMGEIARQATQAFNGNYKIDSVVGGARDLADDAQSDYDSGSRTNPYKPPGQSGKKLKAVVGAESYVNKNDRTYMWSQTMASLLGYTAKWNQSDGTVTIGGKKFTPAWNDNGRTYLGIRKVAEAFGFSTTYDDKSREVSIWDKAHDGAKVVHGGIAELRHDERVLSPQLTASFDRLASVLVKTPDVASRITGGGIADLDRVADRIILAMERRKLLVDKAVNIEHVSFEDRADMQALGVEIRSLLTATG